MADRYAGELEITLETLENSKENKRICLDVE